MFLSQVIGSKQFATFRTSDGNTADGEFLLDGSRSQITLNEDYRQLSRRIEILTANIPGKGWASFLDCILDSATSIPLGSGQFLPRTSFYPHFVALGSAPPLSIDSKISKIGIVVDDSTNIYYDFD